MSVVTHVLRRSIGICGRLAVSSLHTYNGTYVMDPLLFSTHAELIEKLSKSKANTIGNAMTGKVKGFPEVAHDALKAATKFQKCGVRPGDHVMLYSPNHENYPSALLGIMSIGGIPCLANPSYTEHELGAICKATDVKYMVCANVNKDTATRVAQTHDIPVLAIVDQLQEFTCDSEPISHLHQPDIHRDTAVIAFSSGTTGLPKGVMLTHKNLHYCRAMTKCEGLVNLGDTAQIGVLPWYHAFGFTQLTYAADTGLDIQLLTHFDPIVFLDTIVKTKAELLMAVPPLILFLAKHPIVAKYDLSSIREILSGAAPLTVEMCEALKNRHPNIKECRQGYGMTEVTAGATAQEQGCTKVGSVGVPLPGCSYKIVDPDTDALLPDGQPGEILLGSYSMAAGYYNNPAANADTFTTDGFVRTGDIGKADAEGVLWITDRLKELIKVKGYQVAPAELEGLLTSHPLVVDAAVIGIPDDRAGEVPKAFITPVPGCNLNEEDVKKFVASKLSVEKHLGAVEFLEAIPKLPSGKILRKDLRLREAAKRK